MGSLPQDMMGRPLQVGLIGARRIRQGLGPFIARDLRAHGAEVALVLGRTDDSAEEAAQGIETFSGTRPPSTSREESFFDADLDAVCILTPKGTHGHFVEQCLRVGRHVLCEKPVFWHPESTDWAARTMEFEDGFAEQGLVFAVNAQWPWALGAFQELHGPPQEVPRTLSMGLAPASLGREMIGDAAPHPLSLAQALRPDLERLTSVSFSTQAPGNLEFTATLEGQLGPFEVQAEFRGSVTPAPREAWFAIDGKRVDRCVRASDYALFLRDGARIVDLPDPLGGRIQSFAAEASAADAAGRPPRTPDRSGSRRAGMLAALDAAFAETFVDGE